MKLSEIEHVKNSLQTHRLFISLRTVEEMEDTIRAQAEALKIAIEALEGIKANDGNDVCDREYDYGMGEASGLKANSDLASQALSRIKEVG